MQLSRDFFQKTLKPTWKDVIAQAQIPKTGLKHEVMQRRAAALKIMGEETETLKEFE